MTFSEGWIEVLAGGAAEPLDSTREGLPVFGRLERDAWVPYVEQWAKARSASIHYIDNCWLRVAVSASELSEFLLSIDQARNSWILPLLERVSSSDSYVIEAEEF